MFISLKQFLILGGLLGVGGLGVTAVHVATEKTISESLGEYRVVDQESNEDVWTKLEEKLNDTNKAGIPTPKTKVFGNLKNNSNPSGTLKILCQESKSKVYWNIFSKDPDLLEDVKNFCAITIKDSFEDGKLLSVENIDENNTDKTEYKNKMNELKEHKTKKKEQKLDKELNDVYEKAEKDSSSREKHWLDLVKWCSKSYKSYFFNKSDDLWKNVDSYCKKQN